MNHCPSGKRLFTTLTQAEDALLETHIVYEYKSGQGPVAVYKCEDCGYYHFTSRGPMNERLQQALQSGQLQVWQRAQKWNQKLK
jgi:hypothetical protein